MSDTQVNQLRHVRRFYHVYQFIVPLLLFPFAWWLWWQRFGEDSRLASLVLFVPVIAYYVLVGIGVMRFRLWRFNTWPTIGGMRPHHGFVISTAAALFFYLCIRMVPVGGGGPGSIATAAFLGASVFGFWNWWYETYAIKSGFISIYTRPVAEGATAEEAVTDYAPFFFGSMGAWYGAFVKTAENLLTGDHTASLYWLIGAAGGVGLVIVPVGTYMITNRIKHGDWGLESYVDVIEGRESTS